MEGSQNRRFWALIALLIVLLVAVPILMALSMGLFGSGLWQDMGMMGDWSHDWGWMMIIPVVVVIVLVFVLILSAGSETHEQRYRYYPQNYPPVPPPQEGDPQAILDRRLASGTITIEEYNQIKDRLARH